jgi:hypothetical protein
MNLDRLLQEALARKAPPPDLVDRVVSRIGEHEGSDARLSFWRANQRLLQVAAVFLVVVSIGFGVIREREARRERQQGELAARQLVTALQIASETLSDAQRMVQQRQ